jgi:hypothetical protein
MMPKRKIDQKMFSEKNTCTKTVLGREHPVLREERELFIIWKSCWKPHHIAKQNAGHNLGVTCFLNYAEATFSAVFNGSCQRTVRSSDRAKKRSDILYDDEWHAT